MTALTTQQQAFKDQLEVSFASFVTALVAAIEVDNDPNTVLATVRPLREALGSAWADFATRLNLSGGPGNQFKVKLPPGIFATFQPVDRVDFAIDRFWLSLNIPSE